ncbi:peptidase S8/S53 domain-containing protein [Blyttiomyces helicus]|uniref:Peptidase S8/S53 domain-containing protein n=1 Tax=Blyttiomyces helicus TaxID=388810 RepID=A0A4P9WL56_9FUNG|nr:peptidase S8/S53 domain-containing protein [Blyttiomyces helicus]|eukprot:RKO93759.1 peptidase S8/S53 domain-containing protein [Blyttiomyces helicus]
MVQRVKTVAAALLTLATAHLALPSHSLPAFVHPSVDAAAKTSPTNETLSLTIQLRLQPALDIPAHVKSDPQALGLFVKKTVDEHASRTQASLLEVLRSLGEEVTFLQSFSVSNTLVVDLTPTALTVIRTHEDILSIHVNGAFKARLPAPASHRPSEPHQANLAQSPAQWNLHQIGADQVWSEGFTGQNLIYAAADTGVRYTHQALLPNYAGLQKNGTVNHNFVWYDGVRRPVNPNVRNLLCPPPMQFPCDDFGHGTHVMATAVGKDGFGVATSAKWIACRNMDGGVGRPETYLNCLQFFIAPTNLAGQGADPSRRPAVIGNSYGCANDEMCDPNTFTSAIATLRAAGIFMAVASGNDGQQGCSSVDSPPATSGQVTVVGAVDRHLAIPSWSSHGQVPGRNPTNRGVDLVAPGVAINSAWFDTDTDNATISGTSMAAPHVAGAVLLVASACPHLERNVDAIQTLLEQTATPVFPSVTNCGDRLTQVPNSFAGYGQVNVTAAVAQCLRGGA